MGLIEQPKEGGTGNNGWKQRLNCPRGGILAYWAGLALGGPMNKNRTVRYYL
jgi:hypothetical protein